MTPGTVGQFYGSFGFGEGLFQTGLVERDAIRGFGPFESPAVVENASINRVKSDLVEQGHNRLFGLLIISGDGEGAPVWSVL
ncbi:hypothetical protein KDX38_15095 [Pseudomonas sp. CDFA 602]|nr:hypothetical protein [Pseudomonas californiensis]MCD6000533.1 hypothetical protein [Pseudomonas californiensis]